MDNKINFSLPLFALLGFIIICGTILPISYQNNKMKEQVKQFQKEIARLKLQKEECEAALHAFQHPNYIEFLLRTKWHYGRKGERTAE